MHIFGPNLIRRRRRDLRPAWDRLDERCLLSGLTPAEVTAAYGLDGMTFTSAERIQSQRRRHGRDHRPDRSLPRPDHRVGLEHLRPNLWTAQPGSDRGQPGGGQTNDGWALEESLDVEWAHAIAPGANILVVEAGSQSLKGLMNAVNVARNTPGVVAVSMSWGFGEFRRETTYNSTFTTPAGHTGITFLAVQRGQWSQGGARVARVGADRGGRRWHFPRRWHLGNLSSRDALGRQ